MLIEFPLWIAQNKNNILIYDVQLKLIGKFHYSTDNETQMKYLVNLCNKQKDLSLLNVF